MLVLDIGHVFNLSVGATVCCVQVSLDFNCLDFLINDYDILRDWCPSIVCSLYLYRCFLPEDQLPTQTANTIFIRRHIII